VIAFPRSDNVLRGARLLICTATIVFLLLPFRTAWNNLGTDFPNYYTAARLVRYGERLRNYYDWTWFARQMNYAGVDHLGAYTPQTPLTMLPMIVLSGLTPLAAKRVWLVINLTLLLIVVKMLAVMSGLRWEYVAVLLICGYQSLETNFLDGQYYILLLTLITLVAWSLDRKRNRTGGLLSGIAFVLKLYSGPFLLYFLARRKWAAVAAMIVAVAFGVALAVVLFGWSDISYWATRIFPRTLEGGSIDPYNPGVPTLSTLLRRLFMFEPGLNPSPVFSAPSLFFVTRTAVQLSLLAVPAIGVAFSRKSEPLRDLSWFVIASILVSTSTASYTFILLIAPIVWLLPGASPPRAVYLVVTYILLNVNLGPVWAFPKVWILLTLFMVVAQEYLKNVPTKSIVLAFAAIALVSFADARHHLVEYWKEPGRRYPVIDLERGMSFAGYPVVTRRGLFYQSMSFPEYAIRWSHDNQVVKLNISGSALCPVSVADPDLVGFELVAGRKSAGMVFDPSTKQSSKAEIPDGCAPRDIVFSPDGRWAAITRETPASEELWLKNMLSGKMRELAGGSCNNLSPAWLLDSSALIAASDCGRAFGLTALYRIPVEESP
jgi:Glycosyltransferase family 87